MTREKKTQGAVSPEALLEQAIIPIWEQPYKTPHNWMWVKQGSISTFLNGRAYKQTELLKEETLTPILRVGNLFTNGSWYYSNLSLEENKYIDRDDLIYAWSASFGPFIWQGGKVIYHYHIWKVLVSEVLDKKYYYYWLMHDTERLKRGSHGIGMLHITKEMMENTAMPLPPLVEQQRIVDRVESMFAKLDETNEKAQSVLDSFETRKAAILHKAFTGELTAKWRAENGIELDSWSQGCLNDFCEVNPKKAAAKDLPDDLEVSFVPMTALSDILGEITDPQVRKLKEVRTGFTNFSEGDVVFAKITPCMENGKSAVVGSLVNDLGFGTTEFYVLRCSKMLFNRYLYHLVRSRTFRAEAKAVMTGAVGQQRVPKSFLEDYPLTIPSVPEQVEIVHILDSIFAKEQQTKEAAEAVLEKIDLLKKSILARAFRGELGTNDPTEESALELLKQVLQEDAPSVTRKRSKSIPKDLQPKLATELELKIVKLYFKQETDSLPAEELLSVSSKKFEVMETLRNLEQRRILKKLPNGNYRLLE